ncbi:predicted protein [Sclerotinia sclerotiorum 1980 UF-70]|uniref:Uncharacterized protein n=2 Tax=Sclerotinia sclerotiorum (strain ATCC 18683 / 1980 / Ss-1) TaxID=665079 RepID=A7F0V2_SCLS1|nr:predicted protein [Sclerotinia sclerotiorum 1980 UF-70]APA13975.1 hypothetical protein sscle_12g087450 [Sclerotinia sclerotiorum 1980 UF-70]EDN95344.1 predicted protein [Sclerotinia sclerotiorum 1980 UF-70]
MSEVSKQGVEYQAGSSPTDDAIQTTEPSANASEGSNIKQEVENEHNHGEQAEGRPKGWKQYIQQIIGAGRNQLVQMTAQSNSRVPSKSTKNAEEIRKRSAPVGSDNGAVLVPVQANKKTKVEKKDPALAGHSSS